MFDLTKEIDEIRLDYYIRSTAQSRFIEVSLGDLSNVLGVSKGKAQRLIEKFVRLGILEIKTKGNSKTSKTVYKYTVESVVKDTDEIDSFNDQSYIGKTVNDTDSGTDISKILDLYQEHFELTSVAKQEMCSCCKDIDLELLRYLIHQIQNDNTIRFKDRYLIRTLKDLNSSNIKTIDEFIKYTEKYKTQKQNKNSKKNWNYSEDEISSENIDELELIAKMTRRKWWF